MGKSSVLVQIALASSFFVSSAYAQNKLKLGIDFNSPDSQRAMGVGSPNTVAAGIATTMQSTPTATQQQEDDSYRQGYIQQQRQTYQGHNPVYDGSDSGD